MGCLSKGGGTLGWGGRCRRGGPGGGGAGGGWAWGVCRSERAPCAGDAAVDGERGGRRRGGGFAASRGGRDVGAAAQSGRSAQPRCCGWLGEGAGGAGWSADGGATDLCVSAAALLARGREGGRRRLDDGSVVGGASAAGSGGPRSGQRHGFF